MTNPETVVINFKNRGIPASINKADFDPTKHVLWSDKPEQNKTIPVAVKPAEETGAVAPWNKQTEARPAKVKK